MTPRHCAQKFLLPERGTKGPGRKVRVCDACLRSCEVNPVTNAHSGAARAGKPRGWPLIICARAQTFFFRQDPEHSAALGASRLLSPLGFRRTCTSRRDASSETPIFSESEPIVRESPMSLLVHASPSTRPQQEAKAASLEDQLHLATALKLSEAETVRETPGTDHDAGMPATDSARCGDSVGRPHNSRRPERLGAAESRGDGPAGSPAARIDIRNDSAGVNTRPGRLHKQDGMEEDEYYRGTQKYEAAAVAALLAAERFHTS